MRTINKRKVTEVTKRLFTIMMIVILAVSGTALTGCGNTNTTSNETSDANQYDGKLEFDHTMELKYAKLFKVDYYKGGYKMLTVTNRDEDTSVVDKETKILLVPDGMSTPADIDSNVMVLKAPVTNMLVSSTPVTSLMNASGCLSNISLVNYDRDEWYIDEVKQAFDDNKLTYVGKYQDPDYELIVAGAPNLVIYSTMLSSVPEVAAKLKELGINYILDQSTYETEPLGRVEWAKFYGALCDKEDGANKVFNEQEEYITKLSNVENSGKKVAVFYITSKGKLYVRNGGDYLAKMVNMAGGNYIFSSLNPEKTGTQTMEMETFYETAKDADYIIYIWSLGGKPSTLDDFIGYNSTFSDLKAVKEGNVWCTTPDFFQITDTIGSMVNDINLMLNADDNTTQLTYLKKLQ